MPNFRTKVRKSLLALIVSYLRDGTTDTSKFTYVNGQAGTYPHFDDDFTFSLGSDTFQIVWYEHFRATTPLGVTIRFSDDAADSSRAMPQRYTTHVQITIRMPFNLTAESYAQQVALKIDQALYRVSGKCPIKDYDVYPSVDTGSSLEWQTVPRGNWKFDTPDLPSIEVLYLEADMVYFIPKSEW